MMTLSQLLRDLPDARVAGPSEVAIAGLCVDSRAAQPGFVFAALPGEKTDGRHFISDAIGRGASAVLGDAPRPQGLPAAVPYVECAAPRRTLAEIARRFHGAPDERVAVIAEALQRFAAETDMYDVHNVRVRNTEAGEIVNFHCRTSPSMSVSDVHNHVDEVERNLRREFPEVKRVISHAEPAH